ncbi:MAG: hypothetical protein CMP07_01710 [Xanthomonadales bacterium]|nr:hypothetical protein [Xanthomonadales bacterium]|tara:strand:- start:2627 stop:2935 length:309 start_codon:yes stop_codon:yes gene_type:complete
MSNNIEVRYLYRDGSNNKKCQSIVVANPDGITPEQFKEAIRSRFSDLQVWPDILHFQPEKLGWPTAYFPGHDLRGEDLNVHEIDEITLTDAAGTVHSHPLLT